MNITDWRTAPPEAREAWVAEVTAQHPELRRVGSSGELAVPLFAHEPTDALLVLVPGGSMTLGMTEEEHERAREAANIEEERWFVDKYATAGTLQVTLKPFLIAALPLGQPSLKALLAGEPWRASERSVTPERVAQLSAQEYLAYLEKFSAGCIENEADVERIQAALAPTSLRLPSEAEWEHAARAGLHPLFATGDVVPGEPSIGPNPLGLLNLGAEAEICADSFNPLRAGAPADGTPRPGPLPRVVRGGSACCYPWQECAEWTLMLCAARGDGEDMRGFWVIRPALSL